MDLLVNIDVDDLDRAEAFYTSAFDLAVERRFGAAGLELVGGSSRIYLLLKPQGSDATRSPGSTREYRRHWTPVHLDFVVPDVERAVLRALDAGAVLEAPVQTNAWGRLALMADPFGHGFCLVQFLGRGYDEIASCPEAASAPGAAV
jgi:predicted enzyme related to lactoylglutathione lyase